MVRLGTIVRAWGTGTKDVWGGVLETGEMSVHASHEGL
jgi:hypothetical protein